MYRTILRYSDLNLSTMEKKSKQHFSACMGKIRPTADALYVLNGKWNMHSPTMPIRWTPSSTISPNGAVSTATGSLAVK